MRLLAIDTARAEGSVALLRDGSTIAVASLGVRRGFSEVIFGAIADLLARHAVSLDSLDGFAAASGPGSFTGIRVGLSAAKALAEAHGRPLVGVSNLRALCGTVGSDDERPRAAVLDARRGEVFAGIYDPNDKALLPEAAGPWERLAPQLRAFRPLLVANEPHILEVGGPAAAGASWPHLIGPATLAGAVARIAVREIAAGRGSLPESVDANYIRRPSATPPSQGPASER